MTKVEVLKLIGAAQMLWPSWRDAPATERHASLMADTWTHVLADIPAELAMAALTILAAEGREFVPPVGVIRRHAVLTRARAAGELPPASDQAWTEVRLRIERCGRDGWAEPWSHDVVGVAVAAIGWRTLCDGTNTDAVRAHFTKFYGEAVDRFERDVVLSPAMRDAIAASPMLELGG